MFFSWTFVHIFKLPCLTRTEVECKRWLFFRLKARLLNHYFSYGYMVSSSFTYFLQYFFWSGLLFFYIYEHKKNRFKERNLFIYYENIDVQRKKTFNNYNFKMQYFGWETKLLPPYRNKWWLGNKGDYLSKSIEMPRMNLKELLWIQSMSITLRDRQAVHELANFKMKFWYRLTWSRDRSVF